MSNTLRLTGSGPAKPDTELPPDAERRMRHALGLLPEGPRATGRRHGGVNEARGNTSGSPVNRVAVAEAALAAERRTREHAERLLRDAEAALVKATTKLGVTEFARDEALKALAAERAAREVAEAKLQALTEAAAVSPPAPAASSPPVEAAKRRGRPAGRPTRTVQPKPTDQDEPVKWWIPGWNVHS
jgi:hypothetical protein